MFFKLNAFLLTIALNLTPAISKIQNSIPKYNMQDYRVIAELPKENIRLLAKKAEESSSLYEGLLLDINGEIRFFDWESNTIPTYKPVLFLADLDNNNEEELGIILTTGTGTELHIEEVHIINPKNFKEIEVVDPLDIIKKNVQTSIEKSNEDVFINITIEGTTLTTKKKISDAVYRGDKVSFENWIHYNVVNNRLIVEIGAQVSPTISTGEIVILYRIKDDKFDLSTITYSSTLDFMRDIGGR